MSEDWMSKLDSTTPDIVLDAFQKATDVINSDQYEPGDGTHGSHERRENTT